MKTLKDQLAEYEYRDGDLMRLEYRDCYSIMTVLKDYPLECTDKLIAIYRPQPDGSLKPLEKRKKSWSEQLKERGAKVGDVMKTFKFEYTYPDGRIFICSAYRHLEYITFCLNNRNKTEACLYWQFDSTESRDAALVEMVEKYRHTKACWWDCKIAGSIGMDTKISNLKGTSLYLPESEELFLNLRKALIAHYGKPTLKPESEQILESIQRYINATGDSEIRSQILKILEIEGTKD